MSGTRTITLGDRTFELPRLTVKQMRIVFPICTKLQPVVQRFVETKGELDVTTEQMNDISEAVYIGLTRCAPMLTKDDFEAFECSPLDLFIAFLAVRYQTGAYTIPEQQPQGEAPGEAQAA